MISSSIKAMEWARRHRGLVIAAVTALGLLLVVGTVAYYLWWQPNQRLRDLQWMDQVSREELAETAKTSLIIPWPNPHDAFIVLLYYGGPDAVPSLIWGLRWQPDTPPGESAMICTKEHCLDALRRITGHDAGNNYADWAAWWDSVNHQVPPVPQPSDG